MLLTFCALNEKSRNFLLEYSAYMEWRAITCRLRPLEVQGRTKGVPLEGWLAEHVKHESFPPHCGVFYNLFR